MESNDSRIFDSILQYLQHNPDAADTLEGITNWWLAGQGHGRDAAKVERALQHLITEGLVKKTILVDGTVLYSRGSNTG